MSVRLPAVGAAAARRRRAAPPFLAAEHVGLRDAPAGAGAGDRAEVDALGGGDARGDGGDLGVVGDGRRGRLGAAAPLPDGSARRGGLAAPGAGLHARDDLADRDRLALLGEDLGDRARGGRGQLHVDLVGRDLDDGLAVLDGVADLDRPLEDRALGDRLAARRGDDVDDLAAGGGLAVGGARPAAAVPRARPAASRLGSVAAAGAAPFSVAISASTAPTLTVSPSAAWILTHGARWRARAPRRRPCRSRSRRGSRRPRPGLPPACATRGRCPRSPTRPSGAG